MFSGFDSDKGILTISKIPVKYAGSVYEVSDAYESYARYRDYGLEQDIREQLMPLLQEIVGSDGSIIDNVWLKDYEIVYDNTSTYLGHEYYSAFVTLTSTRFEGKSAKFCIFKLPYMDEYGVLSREGKEYALINELVQDDDITYNEGELKIITYGGCYVNLKGRGAKPKVTFRKKGISAHSIMAALAGEEGINPVALIDKLVARSLALTFRTEIEKEVLAVYAGDMPEVAAYVEALKSENYSLKAVRDKVNKTLSIDRALGYSLARSIELKSGEVIKSETIVTKNILKKLKQSAVNELTVIDVPKMQGYYIKETIRLYMLRRGTELIPEVREYFPNEKGNYLNRDIRSGEQGESLVIIPEGTVIGKGMLEMLAYNGVEYVIVAKTANSEAVETVPLVRSIVGNRCFTKRELGISDSSEYVYVTEQGTYEPPSDKLTAYDMAAMISLYSQLVIGKDVEIIANRDLGLRKKVNMANESFHRAFMKAAPQFAVMMKASLRSMFKNTPGDFYNADKLESKFFVLAEKWWQTLYLDMKVIMRIDKSNPLSFYSSFAKINTIVSDKNAISRDQHGLSMGHYGRLCPYETPSSKTMGVVNNRAIGLKIENGIMKTGYHPIKHIGSTSYIDFKVVKYLSVEEEEQYRIADIMSLDFDFETGRIKNTGKVIARVPNRAKLEKMDVQHVDILKVDLVNIDPNQTDGLVATTIPFQGANDSARVIFGLSMAKQAKPCHRSEVPIVMTSAFYNIPRKSPYFMVQAEYDGVVEEVFPSMITVYYHELNDYKTYKFKSQEFSKDSVIIREVLVKPGDEVRTGDIIVTSNFIKDGYLAMGVNVLVAYVPEGYNYEDGVYGSVRLAEKLTSYGSSVETKKISQKYKSSKISYVNKFKYNSKDSFLFSLLQQVGSEMVTNSVYSKSIKGFVVSTGFEWYKDSYYSQGIRTEAVSFDKVNRGDKTANRHGNKGVTPILCDNNFMPRFKNGEFVDAAYNPLGVPSRMNIGQVLECNLGLACYVLGIRANSDSFNGADEEEIRELLSYAWDLANSTDAEEVFHSPQYSNLPKALHEWCRGRLLEIRFWKGAFNKDGTAQMYNPNTDSYFETPVLVGINYVYKLVHLADKKVHGRAGYCTEPYVPKLCAPPKGSSKSGGQRMGYMEYNALAGSGAVAFMHELLNERSDNYVARNNMTVDVLHTGSEDFRLDESTAIRRSTEYFVSVMEALGCKIDFEGELPNDTKEDIEQRMCYKRDALIKATELNESRKITSLSSFADEMGSIK